MRSCLRPGFLGRGCEESRNALRLALLDGRALGCLSRSGVESHAFILPVTPAPCPTRRLGPVWAVEHVPCSRSPRWNWAAGPGICDTPGPGREVRPTARLDAEPAGLSASEFISASGEWRECALFASNINVG